MTDLGQLPMWIIAVVVILKVVFDFLEKLAKWWSTRGSDTSQSSPVEKKLHVVLGKLDTMGKQVEDLYEWHAVKDGDGVPIWYNRRSMEAAITTLADVLGDMKVVLSELSQETKRQAEILQRIAQNQQVHGERLAKLSSDLPAMRMGSGTGG